MLRTAKDEAIDRALGPAMGADDRVSKPFYPRILLARIPALLRRLAQALSLSSRPGPPPAGTASVHRSCVFTPHAQDASLLDKFFYYVLTLLESVLSVVGIRAPYEEPRYAVVERLDRGVEIRAYDGRVAIETDARGQGDGEAFGRLFRYITGANGEADRIAMTAPVETGGRLIAMTVPVEQGAQGTMRFYLPQTVVAAGAPEPTERGVRLVRLPAERLAVLRFSGSATPEAREAQTRILTEVLAAAGRRSAEGPLFMGYDPPFSIPFLRRNEVALRLPAT